MYPCAYFTELNLLEFLQLMIIMLIVHCPWIPFSVHVGEEISMGKV